MFAVVVVMVLHVDLVHCHKTKEKSNMGFVLLHKSFNVTYVFFPAMSFSAFSPLANMGTNMTFTQLSEDLVCKRQRLSVESGREGDNVTKEASNLGLSLSPLAFILFDKFYETEQRWSWKMEN